MQGKADKYDAMGYIKEGKIFHLDGIDKGETADAWTEIVNGYIYTNNGAVEESNGWSFLGSSDSFLSRNSIPFSANNNYTVEVCITPNTSNRYLLINWVGAATTNTPLFFRNAQAITFLQNGNTYNQTFVNGQNYCISINLDIGCINGQSKIKNSAKDYWNPNAYISFIGKRNTGDAYKGKIYSIRLYNKRLTFDEMFNNQQVDNQRFNLGLDI